MLNILSHFNMLGVPFSDVAFLIPNARMIIGPAIFNIYNIFNNIMWKSLVHIRPHRAFNHAGLYGLVTRLFWACLIFTDSSRLLCMISQLCNTHSFNPALAFHAIFTANCSVFILDFIYGLNSSLHWIEVFYYLLKWLTNNLQLRMSRMILWLTQQWLAINTQGRVIS